MRQISLLGGSTEFHRPINEFRPPYQSKNNRIRAGRNNTDYVVTCQRRYPAGEPAASVPAEVDDRDLG
jgi:hypothetical protein